MNTFLNTNKILFAGASLIMASAFVACDDIAEQDRFIKVESTVPERVVLIEDFTGQSCSNCPDAHLIVESLEKQYSDAVVAVSIHGGKLAISKDYTVFGTLVGLANPEGEYYNNKFQIPSWPKGMINRNGQLYEFSDWASIVRSELSRPTDLGIELTANLVNKTKTGSQLSESINIDVDLLPQADIDGALQVWVLESNIVARQTTLTGRDNNYVHNNVLRAAVNGNDGEPVALKKGVHHSVSYSIDVRYDDKERWNTDHLSVVAFVYGADGVHQAAKTNVK